MKIVPLNARPPQTYPSGRHCLTCGVKLSRYNEHDYCSIHTPEPDWRYYCYDFRICVGCGAVIQVNPNRKAEHCKSCWRQR